MEPIHMMVTLLLVLAVYWYFNRKEGFMAQAWLTDVDNETAAPYDTGVREENASATFSSDIPMILPSLYGDASSNAVMPFTDPTKPVMAYLANGSTAASLPTAVSVVA